MPSSANPRKKPPSTQSIQKGAVSRSAVQNDAIWSECLFVTRLIFNSPAQELNGATSTLLGIQRYARELGMIDKSESSSSTRVTLLKHRLHQLENASPTKGVLTENLRSIANAIGLDETAVAVLRHAVLVSASNTLKRNIDKLCDGCIGFAAVMDRFAVAWGIESSRWYDALAPDSALVRSGLVAIDRESISSDDFLSMDQNLARSLVTRSGALDKFLDSLLDSAPPLDLTTDAFPHLQEFQGPLIAALRAEPSRGMPSHFLLSPPPGTGKSQLALLLASLAGTRPLLARSQDPGGAILADQTGRTALGISRQSIGYKTGNTLIVV